MFKDVLQKAKDAGVEGFEDIDINSNYLPRVWNSRKVEDMIQAKGTAHVENVIANSMRRASGIAIKDARYIAKGFLERVRKRGAGVDVETMHGINTGDRSELLQILQANKSIDDAAVAEIMERVEVALQRGQTTGDVPKHGMHRIILDETHPEMEELLENNFEVLTTKYMHAMTGRVAMAQRSHIKGEASFEDAKNFMRAHGAKHGELLEVESGIKSLEDVYTHLSGRPLDADWGEGGKRWSRAIQDYNFLRVMNQVGFPQVGDMGAIFSTEYGKAALKQIPAFRYLFKSAKAGKMSDNLASELEEIAGIGTDFINNGMYVRFDEFAHEIGEDGLTVGAHHGAQVAKRGVGVWSGMSGVNTFMQRTAGKAFTQRLWEMSKGIVKIDDSVQRRLRNMGLSKSMQRRVFKQMKRAEVEGTKVRSVKWQEWDDLDAKDAFSTALHRETTRMVQENDISGTFGWQNRAIGKMLWQFRSFVLQAHTRQGLYMVNMKDRHAVSAMMMQSFFGSLSWTAQKGIKISALMAIGDMAAAKKEQKRLEGWNLPKAAIQRAAWAGMIPMIVDSGLYAAGAETPLFAYRTSGLEANLWTGNPTVDLATNMLGAVSGATRAVAGGGYNQNDARALIRSLPFQNIMIFGDALQSLNRRTLPKGKRSQHDYWLNDLIEQTKSE